MSSITITPERLIAHNFSKPYIGSAISIVSLKNSSIKPCNPQELSGLGVAYQAETTSKFFIEELVESGLKYIPFEYDKMTRCFDELLLNRVDVIVTDSVAALEYTKKQNSQFEITWLGEPYQFFGICIKKGNDALTEAINKALDELFAEGTMLKFSMNNLNVDMISSVRQ
jgi:polar amino acid transport system substrate-binding protein